MLASLGRTLDLVMFFDAPDEELVRRLSGRTTCENCQTPYAGREPGTTCDKCGGRLVRRADDDPASVRDRIAGVREADVAGHRVVSRARAASRDHRRGRVVRRGRRARARCAGDVIQLKSARETGRDGGRRPDPERRHCSSWRARRGPGSRPPNSTVSPRSSFAATPGATPAFKGLYGFPASVCISVNEEIVHGIPSPKRVLREGDIVSLDFGVKYQGLFTDAAITVAVGKVDDESIRLMDTTRRALAAGIAAALAGNHTGRHRARHPRSGRERRVHHGRRPRGALCRLPAAR